MGTVPGVPDATASLRWSGVRDPRLYPEPHSLPAQRVRNPAEELVVRLHARIGSSNDSVAAEQVRLADARSVRIGPYRLRIFADPERFADPMRKEILKYEPEHERDRFIQEQVRATRERKDPEREASRRP